MRDAIALFAKAAVPGAVKTRLTPALSPAQAAAFHGACVRDVWAALEAVQAADAFLYTDRPFAPWTALAGPRRVLLQAPGDLGARMLRCFEKLAATGFERMLIVGADAPAMRPEWLRAALDALADDRDAILGPTLDGGYWAVGCRRPAPAMFAGVRWSTEHALADTRAALRAAGYRLAADLPACRDVDTPADLVALATEPGLGPSLRAWLKDQRLRRERPSAPPSGRS